MGESCMSDFRDMCKTKVFVDHFTHSQKQIQTNLDTT